MKKLFALTAAAALTLGTATAFADDVRVDEAQQLVAKGTIQAFDKLNEKALATQAGTITGTELDEEYGRYIYQVEIRNPQGIEWDVHLDAANGEVLKNEQDD